MTTTRWTDGFGENPRNLTGSRELTGNSEKGLNSRTELCEIDGDDVVEVRLWNP